MPHTHSSARKARWAAVAVCAGAFSLLSAAAPPAVPSPDDAIRQANDLVRAGDKDAADKLYETAEGRAADPGLVAFNRGVVQFDRKQFPQAELSFELVLKDADCPPERGARAWYNWGTCLLWRGGSLDAYREAAACFEHTLGSPAADEALKKRAADNLEIAKLRYAELLKEEANKNKSPNKDTPRQESEQPRPRQEGPDNRGDAQPGTSDDPTQPKKGDTVAKKDTQPQQTPGDKNITEAPVPGNNASLEPLKDTAELQQLSTDAARANLAGVARRIDREQKSLLRNLYGPDRPDVRDW